jgi:hypothetical protein
VLPANYQSAIGEGELKMKKYLLSVIAACMVAFWHAALAQAQNVDELLGYYSFLPARVRPRGIGATMGLPSCKSRKNLNFLESNRRARST